VRALLVDRRGEINDRWRELVSDGLTQIHVGVDLADLIDGDWQDQTELDEPKRWAMPSHRSFDYVIEMDLHYVLYMDASGKFCRRTTVKGSYGWKPSVTP
jgi:hypothetical protein